jgi:uncharacterized protein
MGWSLPYWPPEAVEGVSIYWAPGVELVEKEIAAFRGSWSDQLSQRVPASAAFQTSVFLMWGGWRAGGLMLMGMALYKWGVLTGERSNGFYRKGMIIGLLTGLALVIFGVTQHIAHGWTMEYSFFLGMQYNYWGSLGISFAFISMVMLVCKAGALETLTRAFSAVGRTALSNYLLQTLIGITIFYGPGFGLFGHVERYGQILIVIGIWIFQMIVSTVWVRHFRSGPAEWLWRSLTYWKRQPMRV